MQLSQFTPAVLAAALAAAIPVQAQTPPEKLLNGCAECHGTNGVAKKPGVPHMDAQKPVYLSDSLRLFGEGYRTTTVPQHTKLDREQIQALANHYATQPVARTKGAGDPELIAKGEKIYNDRCADCHFESGRDADKDAPLLAAQNLDYLVAQTIAFRKGTRKFPFMMDDAYKGLSEADLLAVTHYFHSQDPTLPLPQGKRRRKKS